MKKLQYRILVITIAIIFIYVCSCSTSLKNQNSMNQTILIFGMSTPDGMNVTKKQWNSFLKNYVTPAFKEGFTVIDAYGQYLCKKNKIVKENSKILLLLHNNTKQQKTSITSIINCYKKLFQQESVLKISSSPNVSFK